MGRVARTRRVSGAVSAEVARIWGQFWRRRRPLGGGASPVMVCDPLEARVMLAAPTIATIPAQTIDEGKSIFLCASFTDADGPQSCSGYSASATWGDGTCSSCLSVTLNSCGGCGAASGTVALSHVYTDNGNYTATLTINDNGQTANKPFTVTVRNAVPTLTMGGAATVAENGSYTLTLAHTDPGADTQGNWNIQWGDGGSSSPSSSVTSTTHTFAAGYGRPSIMVSASDEDGGPYSAHRVNQDTGFGSAGLVNSPSLGRVQAVAVKGDKIYAAFGNGGGGIDRDFIVARFNVSNGSLDTNWGQYVSGNSGPKKGYSVVDFGTNSSDYASSIAIVNVNGADKIYVAGSRSSGGTNDFAILRFDATTGILDTSSFGTQGKQSIDFNGGYDYAYGMAIQGDKIVLAGSAAVSAGSNNFDFAVARLTLDGALDSTFGTIVSGSTRSGKRTLDFIGTSNAAFDVVIESGSNRIVTGGTVSTTDGHGNDFAVARFTPDGDVDTTFGPLASGSTTVHKGWAQVDLRNTDDNARAVLVQEDGKIVVGGSSLSVSGNLTDFAMARWNSDGTLDDGSASDTTPGDRFGLASSPPTPGTVLTNFAYGSDEAMRAVMQIDGRLVAVGYSTSQSTGTDFAAVRYLPDGSLDPTFGDGGKASVDFSTWGCAGVTTVSNEVGYAIAQQLDDGKLVVGGERAGGTGLIRLQTSNALDVTVIPSAPTGLAAEIATESSVRLTWTDNSQVETGFVIQRSSDGGTTWADVGTAAANPGTGTAAYTDGGLTEAANYVYRVYAVNGTYRSAVSNQASAGTTVKANPDFAEVGEVVHLRAPVGGSSGAVYTWNVYKGSVAYASGTGGTFDFTPDAAGTYYVTTFTQDGSVNTSSTQSILVKEVAPQGVKVVGPTVGAVGRAAVFSASVGTGTGLTYAWSVEIWRPDAEGHYDWRAVSLPAGTETDLSTLRFVPDPEDLSQETGNAQYRVNVVVSNDSGQSGKAALEFRGVNTTESLVDGTADFGISSGQSEPYAVAVQPDDGKVVMAGYYYNATTESGGFAVARFDPQLHPSTGQGLVLDPTFSTDGMVTTSFGLASSVGMGSLLYYPKFGAAYAVGVDDDRRIIAAGEVPTGTDGHSALAIVAYNPDGSLDTTFGPLASGGTSHTGIVVDDLGAEVGARAMVIQSDGKIVVAGWCYVTGDSYNSGRFQKRVFVARYNADGTRDTTFGDGDDGFTITEVGVYPTGTTSSWTQPDTSLQGLAIDQNGKIVAVGWANTTGEPAAGVGNSSPVDSEDFLVMRYGDDGILDEDFGSSNNGIVVTDLGHSEHFADVYNRRDYATSVEIQGGSILVGGWTGTSPVAHGNSDDLAMVRYTSTGALDTDFGSGGKVVDTGPSYDGYTNARVVGLLLQEDGKVVAAGGHDALGHVGFLAGYNSDGTPNVGFDEQIGNHTADLFGSAEAVAQGLDGIYVAGWGASGTHKFTLTRYSTHDGRAVGLTATARVEGTIDLRWVDGGGGEDGYGIERWDPVARAFVAIAYVPSDATTYTDADVRPGTTYRYRVFAFRGGEVGGMPALVRQGQSNEASATTLFPENARFVLQETVRVPVDSSHVESKTKLLAGGQYMLQASGYFDLSPTNDPGGVKHADAEYGIFRPVPYDVKPWIWHVNYGIAVADLGLTDHHDRGLYWGPLAEDAGHTYRVGYTGNGGKLDLWYRDDLYADNETVTDASGTHPYEMFVDVYRLLPQAPDRLTAEPHPKTSTVTLKWRDNTADEMYFQVERSDNGGAWTTLGKVAPDTTTYTDTGLSANHRYAYRVRAHTATDDSPYSNEAVTVLIGNRTPVIDPIANQTVVAGKEFIYRVRATDPDEPWTKIDYALDSVVGVTGMTIDAAGYIRGWTAASGQSATVTVRATTHDSPSDTATQSFSVSVVAPAADRPTISSTSGAFDKAAGNVVNLSASASGGDGANGITYTWTTLVAPADAKYPVFSAGNGTADGSAVTATFGPGSVTGNYVFQVTATDAAGRSETALVPVDVTPVVRTLRIVPRHALAPQNANFPFYAVVRDQFGHDVDVTERPLTWRLDGGTPFTDTDTAVLVATGNASGTHTLSVQAHRGVVVGDHIDDVVEFVNAGETDRWPVIGKAWARPDPNNAANILLNADATDDVVGGDALTYTWTLESGPGSVTFTPTNGVGRQVSAVFSQQGTYTFKVTVSDGVTHPSGQGPAPSTPVVFKTVRELSRLVLSPAVVNVLPGSTAVPLEAKGRDQYGDEISIVASDVDWGLDGVGSGEVDPDTKEYVWTPPATAEGTATVTASLGGAVGAAALKAVAAAKPVVRIHSPVMTERGTVYAGGIHLGTDAHVIDPVEVAADTDVYISVDDPNLEAPGDGVSWTLAAMPTDGGAAIVLASGTGEVGVGAVKGEKVATIHPLLLPQGLYTLRLTADDGTAGSASQVEQQFVVKTPLKLGNFALPVTDLTVQGQGLPITISRVYDSGRANKYDVTSGDRGDFGPGWRMEMPDTDMQVTASSKRARNHGAANDPYAAYFPGDVVYFTLPGGRVEGFQFTPQYLGEYHYPELYFTYMPAFTPLDGSTSKLDVDWGGSGRQLQLDLLTGELFEGHAGGPVDYNPARPEFGGHFILTTKDGTKYDIDATTGMVRTVVDTNGNTLKYNFNGSGRVSSIESYNSADVNDKTSVYVHRDGSGRIDWIEDDIGTADNTSLSQPKTAGHAVTYTYGLDNSGHTGDLLSVADRSNNVTAYSYSSAAKLEHHMTSVTDPRGLEVLSAEYNTTTGEMTKLNDPYKKSAPMGDTSFAGGDARKGVTDLAGNKTDFVYDNRGRVVREIAEVKTAGKVSGYRVTVRDYDDDPTTGLPSQVVQYQPITLSAGQADQRYTFVPHVVASRTLFDAAGNVASQMDAAGRETNLKNYTDLGKPHSATDAYGSTTTFTYDPATLTVPSKGNLIETENQLGEKTRYAYDGRGNVQDVKQVEGTAEVKTAHSEYNGPDGQISVSQSDFRKNTAGVWVPMVERDYTYDTVTIGSTTYRRESVVLRWRNTPNDSAFQHTQTESSTAYDAEDRAWKVTDATGRTTETQYDALGKVAVTIDAFGGRTTYDYDARGNLIRTSYPDGTETRTAYDDVGRVAWQTDRYATRSNPAANYVDNLTAAVATRSVYDDLGRVVRTERYRDVVVKVDTDKALGANAPVILRADAVGGVFVSATATAFDAAGRATATTDAAGVRTETTYYDDGRVKNTRQVAPGLAANAGTTYAYDEPLSGGGLRRQDRVTDALGHTTQTDYDELGRAVKVTYADESYTETRYGFNSQPADNTGLPERPDDFPVAFDGQHVVRIAQRKSTDTRPLVVTHELYDLAGRLTDVWQPKVHDPVTNADKWPHWHYDYDAFGELSQITDPRGRVTGFGNVYADDPNNLGIYHLGQRKTHTRTLPAVNGSTVTETTTYDGLGRTLAVQDFKGQTTAYLYDDSPAAQGRLVAEYRFAAGVAALDASKAIVRANATERTEYGYDDLGRQGQVREYASGTGPTPVRTTNYAYDAVTGAVTLVDGPEGKVHHEYNLATGRMMETWTGPDDQHKSTSTLYGYDALGRLASVSSAKVNGNTPATPQVQRSRFDAIGGVVSGNTLPTTTYEYDDAGDLDKVNLPNDVVEDYHYDDLNRLDHLTATKAGNFKLFEQAYTLRSDGLRDDVVETRYSGTNNTTPLSTTLIDWDYDALGRLIREVRDAGNNGPDAADYRHDFEYDLVGNRLTEKVDLGNNDIDHPEETVAYDYDARDRLLGEDSNVDANDVAYKYDPNGSMTQQVKGPLGGTTVTTRYLWDLRNRMTAVDGNATTNADDLSIDATSGVTSGTVNDAADETYAYDSDGVRVAKSKGGTPANADKAQYLNDGENPTGYSKVLEQRDGGGTLVTTYVLGHDVLGQARAADSHALKYLLKDGHGTTRTLTNADGTPTSGQLYDFQAFGEPVDSFDPNGATTATAYLQADGLHDVETGFEYQLARYRRGFTFISADAPGFGDVQAPQTLHKYLYSTSEPIDRLDPSGHADFNLNTLMVGLGTGTRVVLGLMAGVAGTWNLALSGVDVIQAYAVSQDYSDNQKLLIVGWMVLSMVHFYNGIRNIQVANALLFGTPAGGPLPPNGIAFLRAAASTGDDPVLIGATLFALSPAVASAVVTVAGSFLSVNALLNSPFLKISNRAKGMIGELAGWHEALDRGEVAIQPPGDTNHPGPDYITMKVNDDGTGTIHVYDAGWKGKPKVLDPQKLERWMPEVEDAIEAMQDGPTKEMARWALKKGRIKGLTWNFYN